MNSEEILYLQSLLKTVFDEEFNIRQLNTMFDNQNRHILEQVTKLAFVNDKKVSQNIIALLYKYKAIEQFAFLLAQGNYSAGMSLFKFLKNYPDGLEIISAILKPALIKCTYLFNVHDAKEKIRLKNIWQLMRDMNNKEAIGIARKAAAEIQGDEGLNKIIRNTILNIYSEVFNTNI